MRILRAAGGARRGRPRGAGLRAAGAAHPVRARPCRARRAFPLGDPRHRRLPALHAARAHPGARPALRRRLLGLLRGRGDGGAALPGSDRPPATVSAAFWLMIAVFIGIALLRAPIGLAMIAGCIAYLGVTGRDMGLVAEQILNSLFGSFVLIAVPMFIFAANVMNVGSLSER